MYTKSMIQKWILGLIVLATPLYSQHQAWWQPENPLPGDSVTIYYNTRLGTLSEASSWINLHWGINEWNEPPSHLWPPGTTPWGDGYAVQSPMTQEDDTIWSIALATDTTVEKISFVFYNNLDQWDNNAGQDWHIHLGDPPAIIPVRFTLDTRSANFSYTGAPITQVNLASSFNGWSMTAMPMTQTANPYIWERWVDLYEGTYEYKYVINLSVWVSNPDHPQLTGEFLNSVIIVEKDPRPRIDIESPQYTSIFYDISSVDILARVSEGDDGTPIDETTIAVMVNNNPISHSFDQHSLIITATATGLPNGLHSVSISLADTAGNFREETSFFGIYTSGTGYYAVDATYDENYLYPTHTPDGSSDITGINIRKNSDSLRFTVSIRNPSDYTKLGMQISTDLGPVVESPLPLETRTREWNGSGVFLTVMDPASPLFDPATDNRIYTQRYPPVIGDSIGVTLSGDSIIFNISVSLLESVLGSYNVPWFFYLFSFIPDFEPNPSVGGSDLIIDPDVYDVVFFETKELEGKLLANYIPDGSLGGPRMASLDAAGRGIARIEAYDIDTSLFNPGPVVRLLTRSGVVWDSTFPVDGTISDTDITEAILTINGIDTTISVSSGFFSVPVRLEQGDNIISCRAENLAGYVGSSPSINLELFIDQTPKAFIDTVFRAGDNILAHGNTSYDPQGDALTYLWYSDTLNPEELVFSHPVSAITSFPIPFTDGEYYFNLTVTDPSGNSDFARRFITVRNGAVSIAGTDSIADWVRDAIIYEIFVQSFSDGGDFRGVIAKLHQLKDLGINCIWFMPINPSVYTNGYSVTDYFAIRADFGTCEDLHELLAICRDLGIRVIIDHVINHCSNQHPWMIDAQHFGEYSHFHDHFIWDAYGNYWYTAGADLPDLNYDNEHLEEYMLNMAEYWITEFDISGFRSDMAWTLEHRDNTFWKRWRERLKSKKPEVLLLAEASASDFIYFDSRFDLAYDWSLYHAAPINFKNIFDGGVTGHEIDILHNIILNHGHPFPRDRFPMRFLENHDEPRYITYRTPEQTKLMAGLLLTIPGIPLIYAGQEVGERTLRGDIDWSDPHNLRPHYRKICWIRNNFSSIREPDITRISSTSSTVYSFYRKNDENIVICGFNFHSGSNYTVLHIPIADLGVHPDSTYYMNDLLNNEYIEVTGSALSSFGINFSGYEARIYVLADSIITGLEEARVFVNRLEQNYPNPFRGETVIGYQLSVIGRVSLKIYDVAGRVVRTLVDGKVKPGHHTVTLDARGLASGIYFARFTVGNYQATRKLVLLR